MVQKRTLLLIVLARVSDAGDDFSDETVGLAALALEVHCLVALGFAEAA